MALRVYNTLSRQKEPFETVQPRRSACTSAARRSTSRATSATWSARSSSTRSSATSSTSATERLWVVNITDVDDKLIVQAREAGTTVDELAERVTRDYLDCLQQLGVDGHRPHAARHRAHREIIAIDRRADRQGHALSQPAATSTST